MKHLKLFFALFAMLALGVGNAWAEEVTYVFTSKDWAAKIGTTAANWTSNKAGAAFSNNGIQVTTAATGANGTSPILYNNISQIVVTYNTNKSKGDGTLSVKIGDNAVTTNEWKYSGSENGTSANFTSTFDYSSPQSGKVTLTANTTTNSIYVVSIKIVTSAGSEPPTPTTQYTIKWHTAKGVTTDVTLNEGATITKPATDPTMSGYVFMGWTEDCEVASDGAGFTAIESFGTATEDKAYYAVFAKATTTGGGGSTTGSKTLVSYSGSSYYTDGAITGVSGTNSASWTADAFTMVQNKNSSSSAVALNYAEIRVYASHSIVFTPSTGSTITSIVATATTTDYATVLGGSSIANCTKDVSGSTVTITPTNGTEAITITNSAQSRLKTIVVNYTTSGGGTTTYSDYITTCASGIEYVELGDDFKWSAAEAEVTIDATDNVFPELTNTHNVPVKYSSSDETIASIASDGTVTLKKEGTVTITAKYEGGTSAGTGKEYKAKTVTYSLKVNKAAPVASGTTYVKVTSTAGITDGEYLIVYEDGKVAFNGALTTLDAVSNTIEVEITDGTIAGTNYIDDATFTIDATANTIKSASGYYIGKTASGNGLNTDKTTAYTNTITIDADKNAVVKSSGGSILRYNKASDQARFRYYGSGQQAIALYKKASEHIVTIATCTNGSVSADVASGATVLSGTTITLNNAPVANYKLAAYDVYKTGDATTKVTVTDGKFIMPEFDVTISATFVPAKTLTSIEITSAATQTTFWQGETFNYTGLEVTAHFDGAADEVVTPTVTGSTATAGTQTVTVSFTEGSVTETTTYNITVNAIPNTKETAYSVADAYDIIDKLTTAEGVFISGIISQVDSYNSTYKSITYWISADGTTTNQLQAYSGKGLEKADFAAVTDIAKGAQVIVCGNLKKYSGTYEFDKNNYLAEYIATTKQDAGIEYATTEYTANVNEAFTAPTLTNPNGLTVTYSTSDATLATVNATTGAVTILDKTGKVTITATFAGNESYLYGTASYNITISDPNLTEATFDATIDKGNTEQGEGSIAKSPITFACTDGILGNGSEYRLYKDATITFTAENGYAITKVVLTSTASGTSKYGPGLLSTEEGTYSYSDKTGTWVGEAQTVTLTATAQSRATLITVYYKTDKRQDAGIAWSTDNVSITLGDAFTAPTLSNPNGLTLSCTSDNEDLVTVTNTGVITLKSGILGKATITAKFDGNTNYKDAKVSCTITVNPKTETVVILAQYNGQWYALKNVEQTAGKVLAALPVNYVGGKLYNVEEVDKATIEWQRAAVTDGIIFKNGDNYISGTAGSADLKLSTTECAWTLDGTTYKIGARTFLYRAQANGFKNYNAESNAGTADYSNLPVVTAPVYATGDAYGRTVTTGEYGTICIPYGSSNYTGAEFYEISWMEMDGTTPKGIWLDQVNGALTAGKPYIFKATADEIAIVGDGTTAAAPVVGVAGLTGTFTLIQDLETSDPSNTLEGNYMISGNEFLQCGTGCWLNANRAYIDATIIANHTTKKEKIPGRRRVCLGETSENTTTGVDNNQLPNANIQKVIENGQFIIIRDGVKYNVQGQVIR